MLYTKDQIKETFVSLFGIPPRECQVDIILLSLNSDSPSILLNAGTGIGKSLVAVCTAYLLGGGYVVAPNRPLQWQYETDPFLQKLFERGTLALLMGRANYPCRLKGCTLCSYCGTDECKEGKNCLDDYDDSGEKEDLTNCSQVSYEDDCSSCRYAAKNCYEIEDMCYYHRAKSRALAADIRIINTAMVSYLPIVFPGNENKPVIIYDEAHQLDGFYRMLCVKELFSRNILSMMQRHINEDIPHTHDKNGKIIVHPEDYLEFYHPGQIKLLKDYKLQNSGSKFINDTVISKPSSEVIIGSYIGHIKELQNKPVGLEAIGEIRQALVVAKKIQNNLESFSTKASFGRRISLKYEPILVDFMHAKVLNGSPAPREILMSATIFKGYNDRVLGIENCEYHEFDNEFLPENSPIFVFRNMSAEYKNRANFLKWAPIVITKLLKNFQHRSLIHAHSKENMNAIIKSLPDDLIERIIIVSSVTEYRNCLDRFKDSDNAIMISASLKEGIDLKDDLCRMVIIVSLAVPTPQSAEILGYRGILGLDAYSYIGATSLCQSMGRAIRSSSDSSKIVILDNRILDKAKVFTKFMPPQWRRALAQRKTILLP